MNEFLEVSVPSSDGESWYGVTIYKDGAMECDCPSGMMRKKCRHLEEVWNSLTQLEKKELDKYEKTN